MMRSFSPVAEGHFAMLKRFHIGLRLGSCGRGALGVPQAFGGDAKVIGSRAH